MRDLGSNFFLSEQDVGKPRASACAAKLADLNAMVTVRYGTFTQSHHLILSYWSDCVQSCVTWIHPPLPKQHAMPACTTGS